MKFLCVTCDEVMAFADREVPGDGTLAAVFGCPSCGREIAMLTNPYETQMVSSLGVKIGGRTVPEQPMELVRSTLEGGGEGAFADVGQEGGGASPSAAGGEAASGGPGRVVWSPEAVDRLGRVPSFVRGMVKRIYTDWARERGLARITPDVMDTARTDLGLEEM